MALGNANTIGTAGTSSYCGSTCKQTKFNITSSVSQTIYVIPAVHNKRQYVEAPCTDAANSTTRYHYTAAPWETRIWREGYTYYAPYNIAAGATVQITMELDVTRPNFAQDFAISVWGSVNKPTIAESTGLASKNYYQYTATPVTPETCTAKANLV